MSPGATTLSNGITSLPVTLALSPTFESLPHILTNQNSDICSITSMYTNLRSLPNLSKPQCQHLCHGDSRCLLYRIVIRINIPWPKHVLHSQGSENVGCYYLKKQQTKPPTQSCFSIVHASSFLLSLLDLKSFYSLYLEDCNHL